MKQKFPSSPDAKQRVGRPRKFDRDEVISDAMRVFWTNGFTQTSIEDLVEGTEVGAQSLYNAFGNKRDIFVQALDYYFSTVTQNVLKRAKDKSSVIEGICAVFPLPSHIIRSKQPLGCLMVMSSFEIEKVSDKDISALIDKQDVCARDAFTQALIRGQENGEINKSLDTASTATLLTTLLHGAQGSIRYGANDDDILKIRKGIRQMLQH